MSSVRIRQRTKRRPPRRVRFRRPKPKQEPATGLCQTCNHARDCAFRRDTSLPVIHCEEFNGYAAPSIVEPAAEAQAAPTEADLNERDQYKGLCVNCKNRRDCAIRDKEIGVWHCEEYC